MKKTFNTAMLFCTTSLRLIGRFGPRSSSAFSTLSSSLASKLKDPSLLEGAVLGETFNVYDAGASAQQYKDGSAVIAQVKRMGRDDAKRVS
jgi:hypothetical protein